MSLNIMMKTYYVYILASKKNGTLYIGVTNDLIRRIYEHRNGEEDSFVKKYKIFNLVYYDYIEDSEAALKEEKRLKNWKRQWKINLIERKNPNWNDLYSEICS